MARLLIVLACAALVWGATPAAAHNADPVLEWNAIMNTTVLAGGTGPLPTTRVAALVAAAVFDAVNGIEQRYKPILVTHGGPRRASERAAAIQAAYAILIKQYPLQAGSLNPKRDASIAALLSGPWAESPDAIQRGVDWGQAVADSIWTARSTDGFNPPPPPFRGAEVPGVWRRTPFGLLDGAGPNFASMTPWVLRLPSQFRPPPPPALTSPEYTADYNEVKLWGAATGSPRNDDQSELVLFWNGNTPLFWTRLAARLAADRHLTLLQTARLFARLNLAMADAAIACWDSKYRYVYWRPITAIPAGDTDGNPDTVADPAWLPWLPATPNFPEYLSGHSSVSGAAAHLLAAMFGEQTPISIDSDVRPGIRYFSTFSDALADVVNARIFGGIHFRTACIRGNVLGRAVADYVLAHAMRAQHDERDDDDRD